MKTKFLLLASSLFLFTACVPDDGEPTHDNGITNAKNYEEPSVGLGGKQQIIIVDEQTKKPIGNVTITVTWMSNPNPKWGEYYEGEGYDSNGQYYRYSVEWVWPHPRAIAFVRVVKGFKISGPTH